MDDKDAVLILSTLKKGLRLIDVIILSVITKNPLNWIRFYAVLIILIIGLAMVWGAITTFNYTPVSRDDFLGNLILSVGLPSLLTGLIGGIRLLAIRSYITPTFTVEKMKKLAGYFKLLWILGLIQYPFIYFVAGIGHIDCNQSCVASVEAMDVASNIFFVVWLVIPFYLWITTKRLIKLEQTHQK